LLDGRELPGVAYLSMNGVFLIGTRSVMTIAAGTPVAKIIKPKILKVHAGPTLLMSPSIASVRAVPPKPPAAYINPIARPRFLLKYCAGMIDTIMRERLADSYQYLSNSI
jgi:hypothetical protein